MKRVPAMKLARMLVAALALVGSIGSSPVIGHSHGSFPAASHLNHGFVDHEHSTLHHEGGGHHDHVGASQIEASFFHLHGTWFGMPFSFPASPRPGHVERVSHVLASDLSLMQPVAIVVARSGWDLPFGPAAPWLIAPLCAPSARPSLLTSRPFDGACMPDAVLLRSVSLRC